MICFLNSLAALRYASLIRNSFQGMKDVLQQAYRPTSFYFPTEEVLGDKIYVAA